MEVKQKRQQVSEQESAKEAFLSERQLAEATPTTVERVRRYHEPLMKIAAPKRRTMNVLRDKTTPFD